MRSIAIVNQKGGSGKTTTAVNLAAALGERGRHVLLVDLDPQSSASNWFGVRQRGRGITDIFINQSPLVTLVRPTEVRGVAVVPASPWLTGAERALAWEPGAVSVFRRSVEALPPNQWDYLIADCPPTLGILTANALMGVKEVIIPVEAHHLALPGVDRVVTAVETLRNYLNRDLKISGILACRVDARTRHSREVVQDLRARFGRLVCRVEIRENVRLAEAPAACCPITLYDPACYGAQDYRALAREIMGG